MAAGRPAPHSPGGSSCSPAAAAVAAGGREEKVVAAAEALPWEVRLAAAEASRAEYRAASRTLARSNAELLWRQRRLEKEAMAVQGGLARQGQEKAQEVREGEPLGGPGGEAAALLRLGGIGILPSSASWRRAQRKQAPKTFNKMQGLRGNKPQICSECSEKISPAPVVSIAGCCT